ncbi:MAG: FAD-dependent oxidoreductase [Actinobacteria bacterium HGW-Actinobacteria-7]|jgi:putative flavoprotein involved in K+ transport|nr:MAG: FAD-dependent oxidoreductase [Actinobacteria bacterium HGW-Actinobacteria-7]
MSSQRIETVVVGGGQAGLATSYHLSRRGQEHVVLEQAAQAVNAWRNDRWDSFTLVTPNWTFRVPGIEYNGDDPGGFMPRDEVVSRFQHLIEDNRLPVRFDVRVSSVEPAEQGGYLVSTDSGTIEAANVAIATGVFQRPKIPPMSALLPADIDQLHSGQYRNPGALRDGAVLVVGSAQSGCQIAQELYQHGRKVFLCVGGAGRVPRRYRGRDIVEWMSLIGFMDRTVDELPSPQARFAGNPHLSGRDGGQTLNLHQFVRDGVVLLGHARSIEGTTLHLAPDAREGVAKADAFEALILGKIDDYIAREGIDAPVEIVPALREALDAEQITELDLAAFGITTVIWAMGYSFDFSMVKAPVFDEVGFPIAERGATGSPGLYFVGMPWMPVWSTGLLYRVGEVAERVAEDIAAR